LYICVGVQNGLLSRFHPRLQRVFKEQLDVVRL